MAATAHSDPYSIFLRKIGYAVGLEYTAERVEGVATKYLHDRDLTVANWHELVTGSRGEGNWGRHKSAEQDIANFFYSLRLLQRTSGDALVLENLDAIAICSELLREEHKQRAARDFILLWAILVNDGEIFVNLLLSGFEEQQVKDKLGAMIHKKREVLAAHLKGKASVKRINQAITIERQEKNKGSAGCGQSVTSLKRTAPLQFERFSSRASEEGDGIEFSDDYFRKVPPRRREWAISLGLWSEAGGTTQRGRDFINSLRQGGYIDSQELFIFWPMDYELVRSGFRPDLLGVGVKNMWSCLVDFAAAYAGVCPKPHAAGDADRAVGLIKGMLDVFRSLHVRKAMLRRELPITVAYPAAMALACAQAEPVLDLPAAILAEQKGEHRRVALRQSRISGGALSIKR